VKWKGIFFLLGGLGIGVALGLLVIFAGAQPGGAAGRRTPLTVGSPAPEFTLPVLDGTEQALSDLRGTPVLINFWATWCIPCREEMPLLEQTAKQYSGRLVVVGINAGEEEAQVKPFLKEVGVTIPVWMDRDQSVSDRYFVRNFPMTLFIDEKGIIRGMHIGTLNEEQLPRYLATVGIVP
jgi:thiol-disulfide isomerase/thioredoxin